MLGEMIKSYLFVSIPEKYQREFKLESYKINIARGKVISIIIILLKTIMLTTSFITKGEQFYIAPNIYYVIVYIIMIITMTIYLVIFLKIDKRAAKNDRVILIVEISFISFILLWSAVISLLDQLSYGQIIVYVAAFIGIAVFSLLKPYILLFIYLPVHTLFIAFMPYFQKSRQLIFLNYTYTTIFLILSWAISQILYKNWVATFNNKKVIHEKNDELYKINIKLVEKNQKLEKLSCIDNLTGACNRRKFNQVIKLEWDRCKRYCIPLSIIIIDVDFFKAFNDNYGHQSGDNCLKKVTQLLLTYASRSSDLVARYGGEEFAIVLPHCNSNNTYILAERIRKGIEELFIPHAYSSVAKHVTISLGTSTIIPSDESSIEELIRTADEALYKAKSQNRNLVVSAVME